MKICIGVAASDYIRTQTVSTLILLFKNEPDTKFIIKQGALVHLNREEIALEALQMDCTHLFFVDSDMVFNPDVLYKLMHHDKDIIGALCNKRGGGLAVNTRFTKQPDKIYRNSAVGMACTLIKMDVFRKVPRPWFFFGDEQHPCGEDIFFCNRARKVGFEVWIDPTLSVKHIGEFLF